MGPGLGVAAVGAEPFISRKPSMGLGVLSGFPIRCPVLFCRSFVLLQRSSASMMIVVVLRVVLDLRVRVNPPSPGT